MATGGVLSLYELYSIATVIDDFIDRIMVDPRLNANQAHHRVPPAGFKYLVTEMVCWATSFFVREAPGCPAREEGQMACSVGEPLCQCRALDPIATAASSQRNSAS